MGGAARCRQPQVAGKVHDDAARDASVTWTSSGGDVLYILLRFRGQGYVNSEIIAISVI